MPETCAAIVIAAKHGELIKVRDYSGITNTVGALRCKFEFRTNDWDNATMTAVFCKGNMATNPEIVDGAIGVLLDSIDECAVPAEVLTRDAKYFSVGVWGVTTAGFRIVSKWLVFRIEDGCYVDATDPIEPTPTVYEQIMLSLQSKAPIEHEHNDIYYTKTEVDEIIDGVQPGGNDDTLAEDVVYSNGSMPKITNVKEALDTVIAQESHTHSNKESVLDQLSIDNHGVAPHLAFNGISLVYAGECPSNLRQSDIHNILNGHSISLLKYLGSDQLKYFYDRILEDINQVGVDLSNYYLKSETYSQNEIDEKISLIPKFSIEVIDELPTQNISETTIYLLKDNELDKNLYTEYIYINNKWETLGSQAIDLEGYAKTEDIPTTAEEVGALPATTKIPSNTSDLTNDSGFITANDLPEVTAENISYTTPYMPGATNVKEALDATGEGFVSITQNINSIHENFMRTADAEQKIEDALASAKASGEFKGEKGESIAVRNINQSTEDGGENIVYFTDGNVLSVKNGNTGAKGKDGVNGKDGANGIDGKNGVTFTPIVSDDGTLSWTNDGELENPAEINIKGEAGKSGVYIGDGDMPDDCNVKINPNGGVIRVPTKLSELDNDKGFITKADIPTNGTSDCISPYYEGTDVTAETDDEQRVIDAYQNMMSECMGDSEKIPFLLQTDNHNYFPKGIYNLCAKMINFAQFSQILTLGDIAGNYFHETHLQNFVDAMKVFPIEKKTAIAGNHDVWVGASDRSYIDQSKLSKYLKNYTLRRYGTNGYGVLIDDYFNMKYLIISNYDKDEGESGSRISTKQVNFIIDELSKRDGYDVVILSHEPISLADSTTTALLEAGVYTTMGNYFSFIPTKSGFISMLLARKNKSNGTYTDDEGIEHTYDFTECNSDLLCCFCGHTHVEGFDFINGELLNVAWGGINHADGHPIYFGYIDKKNRLLKYYRVAGDYSSSVTVGLDKVNATNMTLNKTEIAMSVGELEVISPIFTPVTAGNQRVVWTSSNNAVATVKKGFVSGIAEGTATITAVSEDGSFTATCSVTVGTPEEPEEPDIPDVPDEPDVPSGGEDSEGNLPNDNFTVYAEPYTWTTGYPNAAGTIIDNEYSAERVTAEFLPITVGSEVCLGNTDALFDTKWIAVAFYTENQECIERQVSTTYKDENGKYIVFTAPKGSAYMKVSATMSAVETAVIYINQVVVAVESITLNETATVKVDKTQALSATVNPANATNKALEWTSSDNSIATVDQNGVVTGVTIGDATITCSATDGSGVSASCLVTVKETIVSNLPAEYQEVEYIYTTAYCAARIPTTTTLMSGDKGYMTVMTEGRSSEQAFCGLPSKADIYVTRYTSDVTGTFSDWQYTKLVSPAKGTACEKNTRYNIEFDITGGITNLFLMAYDDSNKYGMVGKMYSARFTRNGVDIYNFVPCYRIADGKIGMYDTVNNVFAEGVGELFKGEDV